MYIADLHIHSRFSRATSRDCDLPHLDWWAGKKGITLVGTGDFTHPVWRRELKEQLVPAGDGVYKLRDGLRLEGAAEPAKFLVTGEISCIYKRDGKTRKVHHLILLPSLEAAEELSVRLEAVGNIHSDGRPILGMDSRDLLELTLETCPEAEFIPAHIWTPHFSMFGAFSGFDSIEDCFGSLSGHIHAAETGLSSDPPMNWRVSALDRLTLVSHSDAHSPGKLGREADLLETGVSYPELIRAIRTGEGFYGTVEFFPEEGKYHLDGHRSCGVCLTPAETQARNGRCPVCGKKLTIGVEHRVEALADRPAGMRPAGAKPFESLAPLPEVIAASTGVSAASKRTSALYTKMLDALGPEFFILREAPVSDIERTAGPCVAEGIRRLRLGEVERRPGFDGEYGVIS
nr:endonuclease Q family protein [Oscillospiraceae bacterium]